MTNYAYAPAATLQTISSASVVAGLIERDHGFPARITGSTVRNQSTGATATVQSFDTYPQQLIRVGAVDRWTSLQTTVQDGPQGNGHWQTTENYGDMPVEDARAQARRELGVYYQSYIGSFFQAGANWYAADPVSVAGYQSINGFVLAATGPVNYAVVDTAGTLVRITSGTNWNNFMAAWHGLFVQAQTDLETAWIGVRDAVDTNAVRTIMTTLPPVPTDPNNPGP